MKKFLVVILSMCLLGQSVWLVHTTASSGTLYLAVNDELQDSTLQTKPILVGGITYIPITVFDTRLTGVNLGVSYGWDYDKQIVSLYSKSQIMEFDLKKEKVFDYNKEVYYNYAAVVQNGIPYVPALWSCRTFGLEASFVYSFDSEFRLLRIKNGDQILSDDMYMRSVRPILEERENSYEEPEPVTPEEEPIQTPEERPDVAVYMAIQVKDGMQLSAIMTRLERSDKTNVIFFFSTSSLIQHQSDIRVLKAKGHCIGLVATGNSQQEILSDLKEGNMLLRHILRQRAFFVLDNGFSSELLIQLKNEGLIGWNPSVVINGNEKSSSEIYRTAINAVNTQHSEVRVLFDDFVKTGTLRSVLQYYEEESFETKLARETAY